MTGLKVLLIMATTVLLHNLITNAGVYAKRGEYLQDLRRGKRNLLPSHIPTESFRLVGDLSDPSRYNKYVRPVRNDYHPVDVTMKMNLYQILDVLWVDEFLGWDPANYAGINWTVLPYDMVWLPDTYLYNNLQMERVTVEHWSTVIVTTNTTGPWGPVANIRFQYPTIYQFSCKMHTLYFPFDKQNCTMVFGSWVYDAAGIRYFTSLDRVRNESFIENEEWSVVSFEIVRHENLYSCCPNPYTELHACFVIQRKPLWYIINLIIPTAIIALIAVVGFFTPASSSGERSEKINLGITTLLAMSIFLLMVSDRMPATSDFVPLIGWFFLSIIILISLGTFLTAVMIFVQQQGRYGHPVPKWLKNLCFVCLAKCLLMRLPPDGRRKPEHRDTTKSRSLRIGNSPEFDKISGMGMTIGGLLKGDWTESGGESSPISQSPKTRRNLMVYGVPNGSSLAATVKHIHEQLVGIELRLEDKENKEITALEWEYCTAVFDRFLLIFFSLAILLITITFLILGSRNYVPMFG